MWSLDEKQNLVEMEIVSIRIISCTHKSKRPLLTAPRRDKAML